MQPLITMIEEKEVTTSKGEKFQITFRKKPLSPAHSYWMYTAEAFHNKWVKPGFVAIVTKAAYPTEDLADKLAENVIFDECVNRLAEVDENGKPIYFPEMPEGWCVM